MLHLFVTLTFRIIDYIHIQYFCLFQESDRLLPVLDVRLIYCEDSLAHIQVVTMLGQYIKSLFVCNIDMVPLTSATLLHTSYQINIVISSIVLGRHYEDIRNGRYSDISNVQRENFTILDEIGVENTIFIYFDYMYPEETHTPHCVYDKYKFRFKLMQNFSEFLGCLQENIHPIEHIDISLMVNHSRYQDLVIAVEMARDFQKFIGAQPMAAFGISNFLHPPEIEVASLEDQSL